MSERNPRRDDHNVGTEDDEDVEGTVPQVEDYPARNRKDDGEDRETDPEEETDETTRKDSNR